MDYREIQRLNLSRKSKKEIIEFLKNILGEYGVAFEYGVLKEILTPEQMDIIDKAIEADERAFAAEDPDFTENDIKEWLEEDSVRRRLIFSKNEAGEIMLSDWDSRMQDTPEISEISFEDLDIAKFVDVVQKGIEYTLGMGGMQHNSAEINVLQEKLTALSKQLKDINQIKNSAEKNGGTKVNALLELLELTGVSLSTKDIETLIGPEEAKIARDAITEEASLVYSDNGSVSAEVLQELRDEYVESDNYYNIGTVGTRMVLKASMSLYGLPEFKFDTEKMANPEFTEALIEIIERNQELMSSRYDGFYGDEINAIIENAINSRKTTTKDFDISAVAKNMAQEKSVALESFNAKESMDNLISRSIQEKGIDMIEKESTDSQR